MALHKIKKGLDLPIEGQPDQRIEDAPSPSRVALVATDYHGMRPTMQVKPGDSVRRGELLFVDKKTPGVRYTAPGGGKVVGVHRGAKRALQSVVIELDEGERSGRGGGVSFASDTGKHPRELSADQVRELLVQSGLWTALRTRPFGKVADPETRPHSIFITATDSQPLAPDPAVVLAGSEEHFERGTAAVAKLTEGPVFVCARPGANLPSGNGRLRVEHFAGPHPSGTAGFQIHRLDPVDRNKLVWYLGYQDVVAIGKLFLSGELDVTRVVSLAGPPVSRPRLLRTRIGASVDDLTAGEAAGDDLRRISGSVLSGRIAQGEIHGFLGRYDQQISILAEDREREFLGWLGLGGKKYSTLRAFLSSFLPAKRYELTTSTQGSDRAIIPIGMYEKVFPFDILPSFLLKALVMHDIEQAEALGALELDEEDLALLTFVCPGKADYGVHLRDVLTTIEKEG